MVELETEKLASLSGKLLGLLLRRASKHPVRTIVMANGVRTSVRNAERAHLARMRAIAEGYPASWPSLGMRPKISSVRSMSRRIRRY